jgi:UDP-N-acetylglucosamine 2-epimerase (non-hydrolysing)
MADAETITAAHVRALLVIGTRPELVKMASTINALRSSPAITTTVVFSGQHTELLETAAEALGVEPDIVLAPLPAGRSLTDLLGSVVRDLGRIMTDTPFQCVIVQGDTVTSLAGALASELLAIPLVHVEAGVRSLLRDDPFPEETTRRIISSITELHICFSEAARQNLLNEGHPASTITVAPHPLKERVDRVRELDPADAPGSLLLITLHRRERRRQRAMRLLQLIAGLRRTVPTFQCTFVWHPALDNDLPELKEELLALEVSVVPPLEPNAFLLQLVNASAVLTDSAGVSEEAQLLGKPLVAFRTSAEQRIDEAPVAPTCCTESIAVAQEFLERHIEDRSLAAPSTDRPSSSGLVIVSCIESLVGL